jgi:hypothetical protein
MSILNALLIKTNQEFWQNIYHYFETKAVAK